MKKILIVGGSGFLGSKILQTLSNSDSYLIYVYDFKKKINYEENKQINFIDIQDCDLKQLFEKNNFHFIINAAVVYDSEFKFKVFDTNFIMPLKLIEYGKKNGCKNFIFFDSFFSKFEKYNKKNNYINSKKYFKNEISNQKGIKSFNLMLEHMYGPNDNPNKFIEIVNQNMHNKIDKMDLTLGNQKRYFVHVEDVCDLVVCIIIKITSLKIKNYNFEVGNGKSISIRDFLTTMKIIFNSNINLNFGGIEENKFEINDSFSNINTIPSQLNWKPKISIDKGIKSLIIN